MQLLKDHLQSCFHERFVFLPTLFERRDLPVRGNKFNGTVLLVPRVLLTSWLLLLQLFDLVLQVLHLVAIVLGFVEQVHNSVDHTAESVVVSSPVWSGVAASVGNTGDGVLTTTT